MGLPAVASVNSPLQQGRNLKKWSYLLTVYVLLGPTAQQSAANLHHWLDAVAIQLHLQHSFVFDRNNIRAPGIYRHLGTEEEANFRRSLNLITTTWGNQVLAAEQSCGSMMEMGSGGKGSLFMCTFEFGPFQGQ